MALIKSDSISHRFLSQDGIYIFSCFPWQTAHKPLDTVIDFCSALCYMEPKCVSYNELVASGYPVITKCELNNSTHNEHPQDLKSRTNYKYKGTMVSTFLSYLCFSFIIGLLIFDGWLVSCHVQANNITCHLVD